IFSGSISLLLAFSNRVCYNISSNSFLFLVRVYSGDIGGPNSLTVLFQPQRHRTRRCVVHRSQR
ncbi:MAG: hypothetical protein IJD43_12950, partial [Thermoguttaceae bacterium]|nr:hypothetical protein [Thermoguttaceae bacterium]